MSEINIVDSLAEITGYRDKGLVEQSLVNSIHELFPDTLLRLFSVTEIGDSITFQLISARGYEDTDSLAKNESVDSAEMLMLDTMVEKVMLSKSVERLAIDEGKVFYFLCPVFNEDDEIFATLLVSSTSEFSSKEENICLGMLKVYSNYLNLLDNTQRDKLTGLFNRETLDHQILQVLHHSPPSELNSPATKVDKTQRRKDHHGETYLGVIDIDHFKSVNDTYGHLYGDEILVLVARCMTDNFTRADDLVYRYGGEEFVILVKAANEDDAKMAFERLRINIEEYDFPQVGKVTISIGFEHLTTQTTPQEVIAAADAALYVAKKTGRNQTLYYPQLILEGKIAPTSHVESGDITLF